MIRTLNMLNDILLKIHSVVLLKAIILTILKLLFFLSFIVIQKYNSNIFISKSISLFFKTIFNQVDFQIFNSSQAFEMNVHK